MQAMKNSTTMYPRQSKPGIKQLGKLDKERRERDARIAKVNCRIAGICDVFKQHPSKCGSIAVNQFYLVEGVSVELTIAVAMIYCNITAEYNAEMGRILFLRNSN